MTSKTTVALMYQKTFGEHYRAVGHYFSYLTLLFMYKAGAQG